MTQIFFRYDFPVSIRTTFGIQQAGCVGSGHAEFVVAQHLASERVREATEGPANQEHGREEGFEELRNSKCEGVVQKVGGKTQCCPHRSCERCDSFVALSRSCWASGIENLQHLFQSSDDEVG